MRYRHLIFFLTFIFLTACSVKSPIDYFEAKIYKLDVQQGNIITAEMLMGLKPGMTRAQVKYVLGTPLIQDSFHENRWDYIYKMIKDDRLIEERHVVVRFADDELVDVKGDIIQSNDILIGAETERQSKVITLSEADYAEQKKDKNSLLSRLKFWEDETDQKTEEATIKISKEELEEEKKDSKSLLSRLKFWESETETAMTKDMPVEKESKAIPIEEKSVDVMQAEEKLLSQEKPEKIISEQDSADAVNSKEEKFAIDETQSMSSSVKDDIIKSLPDESDPKYFELLLEKIGF
ncbi:MAG: outer membrane protein assembly factor BamE [Methylophilaceae bacterium]|jgi:outer membrane protein assembly factor BamE|nr:outer membrane protein assembly factor BamE [Methylophilaceae bacterium]NCV27852.1 outer membrane protein assembly factor BamE [Nitrosomonadales bacterium]NCV38389.1 outer membrane protein assembly factor BamE [Betaproteobacteria bacterium]NCV53728.1 outer membrane protein assembly factor BamE [Betaproteobacteria bacterium]NCX67847.1 outer membrane protein assembly factor BamE [Betaproteobacteria bacterium]